jgi:hypothetical protein
MEGGVFDSEESQVIGAKEKSTRERENQNQGPTQNQKQTLYRKQQ